MGARIHPFVTFPRRILFKRYKKTNYFKLTLPRMGSKLNVTLWASQTPEEFILHVRSMILACKQMGHEVNFSKAKKAVVNATLDLEKKSEEYAQVCSSEKKGKREQRSLHFGSLVKTVP